MKKLLIIAVSALMVLSSTACSSGKVDDDKDGGATGMPNPIVTYDTLAEVDAAIGFSFKIPAMPVGYDSAGYSVIDDTLAQADYTNGTDTINFRTVKGIEDPSGDYTVYDISRVITVTTPNYDVDITVSGSNDNKINLAVWSYDEYSYSFSISGAGLDEESILKIVADVLSQYLAEAM